MRLRQGLLNDITMVVVKVIEPTWCRPHVFIWKILVHYLIEDVINKRKKMGHSTDACGTPLVRASCSKLSVVPFSCLQEKTFSKLGKLV